MTGFAAVCIGLAAVAVMWPEARRRARRRRILAHPDGRSPRWNGMAGRLGEVPGRAGRRHRQAVRRSVTVAGRSVVAAGRARAGVRLAMVAGGAPAVVLAATVAVALGVLLSSVVVGVVAGAYGTVAARRVARRRAERAWTSRRAERLDLLTAAAADLRAGLPAGTALAGVASDAGDPLRARVLAAVVLAERTGAPLAEVLERIEADARGTDRARAASAAQTAGSQATAFLLAGLPVGGIALGYAIGADPLHILLRTPVGAGCALGAVTLQLAGLGWVGRITRGATAVAA